MGANTVIPFYLSALQGSRDHRLSRIDEVLGTSLLSCERAAEPLAYVVAHHLLEGAERAARDGDADLLGWYRNGQLTAVDRLLIASSSPSPHIVINPPRSEMVQSELSDTAYYLLQPATAATAPALRQLVSRALDSASGTGFADLLALHATAICLMDNRTPEGTLFSWSITRLPGTVFTDFVDGAPEILARDLIHEAGHHWLNEALALTGLTLPDDSAFYSPWRETIRPVFGFLHACWAFSLTVIHVTRALPATSPATDEFMQTYLRDQAVRLREASADFQRALRLVGSELLRHRIATAFLVALECTEPLV